MIERDLAELNRRLEQGEREYGGKSFSRRPADLEREIDEELLDLVGWLYVLWSQAGWKAGELEGREHERRAQFLANIRHRALRNDRSSPDRPPTMNPSLCMVDLEILAVDCLDLADQVRRRLHPIARALEVARAMGRIQGRRGGS